MRIVAMISAVSVSVVLGPFAFAQKGQKTTVPASLVVVDSTGKVAGRVLGTSGGGTLIDVVVTVNGALTVSRVSQDQDASGAYLPAARWRATTIAYFATADCSGLPILNALGSETVSPGFRASQTYFDGSGLILRVAVTGPSSIRSHQSYGYPRCSASGVCQVTGCVVESKSEQQGWNVEATINLDQTYPGPLTVQ